MQKQKVSAAIIGLFGLAVGWASGRSFHVAAATQAQTAPPPAQSASHALYFSHADMDSVWKDLEARNVINKRVVDGGKYSLNVRTIRETDGPMTHSSSIDIWIMEEGSATAITGGKLIDPVKKPKVDDVAGSAIAGGTEQAFRPGDILYVPAGVPHGFKEVKGFRAYLIRFDLN